jgi:hypothetical protein
MPSPTWIIPAGLMSPLIMILHMPGSSNGATGAGDVAVFVWYDEDHPAPNLWIAPSATPGSHALPGAGYAGTLAAWEHMLGLRCIANACNARDMREAANV